MEHHDRSGWPVATWEEHGIWRSALWRTAGPTRPPPHVVVVADDLSADRALRCARAGTALLWRGDYRNARQLLDAMKRRLARRRVSADPGLDPAEVFRRHRQDRAHRARVLSMVLVELAEDYGIELPHAPDVGQACREAYGPAAERSLIALQELIGVVGAGQWRRRGVDVPALGARIYPHYGVFAPTRREYVDLVARAPLPAAIRAFDIGTGTGVLAAVLARRGIHRVVATDINPAAVACARDNIARLGLSERVEVHQTDLFPPGHADLVVCNPPWLPATPTSALEAGVFDRGGRMLTNLIRTLPDHLGTDGEAWIVLSDLAELFGLRIRDDLLDLVGGAGLTVRGRLDIQPRHNRTQAHHGSLDALKADETISLWRLAHARALPVSPAGMAARQLRCPPAAGCEPAQRPDRW